MKNFVWSRMLHRLVISVLLLFATITAYTQPPQPYHSFKPGEQWLADDGLHIDCHGGNIIYIDTLKTFYWYGEAYGSSERSGKGAACYSSTDLYNWKYEGIVLEKGNIEILERPKVVYDAKNHLYVMWFHYDTRDYRTASMGMATSTSPTGPFTLQNHLRPNGHESRDIGMYIDPQSKKAYIGYAADHINRTIRMVALSDDYRELTTEDKDIEAHCEGPGILKKKNTYYMLTSGCSGWTPNPATYYTAENIMGPYTQRGHPFVGDAGNNSFNSQPCYIFKIPGYKDAYLYMGDRWNGYGHADSRYVFLPITITEEGEMQIHWYEEWDLSMFTPVKK